MSSVMLASDTTVIERRCDQTAIPAVLSAQEGESLLRRAQGFVAGVAFVAARAPVYVAVLLFGALVLLVGTALYALQAAFQRLIRPAGMAAATALALLGIAAPHRAKADTITDTSPLRETTLVFGQQASLYSFQTDGAGTLDISLKDWGFPVSLKQLTASILSNDQVLGSWTSASASSWQFEVPISSGGLFDAFVAAQAGTFDGLQFGAYSMSISFEPASTVPLPPGVDLLLGGMGLLGAVSLLERLTRRRNTDVISVA